MAVLRMYAHDLAALVRELGLADDEQHLAAALAVLLEDVLGARPERERVAGPDGLQVLEVLLPMQQPPEVELDGRTRRPQVARSNARSSSGTSAAPRTTPRRRTPDSRPSPPSRTPGSSRTRSSSSRLGPTRRATTGRSQPSGASPSMPRRLRLAHCDSMRAPARVQQLGAARPRLRRRGPRGVSEKRSARSARASDGPLEVDMLGDQLAVPRRVAEGHLRSSSHA